MGRQFDQRLKTKKAGTLVQDRKHDTYSKPKKNKKLKKVLIISYFFPPCNLTAANRIASWAKYLHMYGYYPVIITRNWESDIGKISDMLLPAGKDIIHEQRDGYEVYYLPYRSCFRDRLHRKNQTSLRNLTSKFLTFFHLLFQNFTNKAIPFSNIYQFAYSYLKENKDFEKLIISGAPFELFRFGYILNKKLGIKWIADYRDGWTTQIWLQKLNLFFVLLKYVEKYSEKKWIRTSSLVTSVSALYSKKISAYTKVPSKVIINGYFEEDLDTKLQLSEEFSVAYSGTVYDAQDLEGLISGIKKFINQERPKAFKVYFLGIRFNEEQFHRFKKLTHKYDKYFIATPRINRKEAMVILQKCHLLLMMSYGQKGIPSSKLYEYVALQKPVLLYPSDQDIIEKTLKDCGVDLVASTPLVVTQHLRVQYQNYLKGDDTNYASINNNIKKYSRKYQTQELSKLLDSI